MFCKVLRLEQPGQCEHAGENVMTLLSENAIVEAKPAGASNPVEGLLRLVSDVGLHRGSDGRLYARAPVGGHHEFYEIRSGGFRDWLVDAYFAERGALTVAGAISRVIGVLEARATVSRRGAAGLCANGDET